MSYDRLRLYDAGRFQDTELPDWYREAERLCETEHVDFHRAFDRVLGCEHTLLGKNPWRAPLGAEAHAQRAATMNRNRASGFTAPDKTQAEIDALPPEWERVPGDAPVDSSLTETGDDAGGGE